ncbi:5'-methylthioadenosine/adenosylhomocysteine nucleosidase [Piscinibacter koreensis]|nr:5'-methylthioadenosine/adenosylhomocysteine nucleosidase [Schlegelella koreensis]
MPDESPLRRAGREFWAGHLSGHAVVVALSGIGKVAAATTATLLLAEFDDVDRVVFTGTAGGLEPGVEVGDIVVADALLQHDLDASPLFPRHEVPLYGTDRFRTDVALSDALADAAQRTLAAFGGVERLLAGATGASQAAGTDPLGASAIAAPPKIGRVHRGLVVSGDRFVSGRAENDALCRRLPGALAVEMEGAAVAQVCHDFGVPFAVVRTISDRADDAAHVDFTSFVEQVASRYTLAIVEQWLAETSAVEAR